MRKLAILLVTGALGIATQAEAQTPAQAPARPKTATAPKAGTAPKTATARSYDRALLRPALFNEKAPETYQVKFDHSGRVHGERHSRVGSHWGGPLLQSGEASLL